MADILHDSFNDFLTEKGIQQVQRFDNEICKKDFKNFQKEIVAHLQIISEFHKLTMGYDGAIGKRLDNSTGKKVEQYKVFLKKFKRDLRKIKAFGPKNSFECMLIEYGDKYIRRSEKCLESVYDADYYGLIERSMKRIEICLGNTSMGNLSKQENIKIVDINDCSYNMVECDCLYFLSKLKRSGVNLDWKGLIGKFCSCEALELSSEKFIAAMLSFPYEFMKCCDRYRYGKKEWSEEQYEIHLRKAMEKDGESII